MNSIRQIRELNQRELDAGVKPEASWHTDYRDTAYVYVGGLPFELSEGDIVTIFSQYGEPTFVNLIRDKETGKSKGFAFLKYEDQRSTDLAVDNLGGAVVMGRTLRVDHTRYKRREGEDENEGGDMKISEAAHVEESDRSSPEDNNQRPMIKEEAELARLIRDHDEDDPMKAYLISEKREEVRLALQEAGHDSEKRRGKRHKHHHRSSRRHRDDDHDGDTREHKSHRSTESHKSRRRSRSRDSGRDEHSSRRRSLSGDERLPKHRSRRRSRSIDQSRYTQKSPSPDRQDVHTYRSTREGGRRGREDSTRHRSAQHRHQAEHRHSPDGKRLGRRSPD